MIPNSINTPVLSATEVKKPKFAPKLNLVALMDIFTILVFFLLLNTGDADRLQNAKFVSLPDSSSASVPHVEATIVIDAEEVWLNDELVVTVADIGTDSKSIEPLAEALQSYIAKRGEPTNYEKVNGLAVTIMGDKSVPFSLLERVMKTCSTENFRDISLAVNRVVARQIAAQPANAEPLVSLSKSGAGSLGDR
ncbi:biopolymer transporter ExbD [Exilibacterium tricleocarpae]|uniref:Biopolymer transporter ExbD n=1 Tax=Exilibacterium tricleocarpae TaxID=2591008 RepID=A0A545TAK1_9GAMM|nr:biopolymer transporter ExbD [Exilibacterium tricleocarpae]TQV74214.1 biopolymer transporter ExbD [Exilibacterium tricleocarpae]